MTSIPTATVFTVLALSSVSETVSEPVPASTPDEAVAIFAALIVTLVAYLFWSIRGLR